MEPLLRGGLPWRDTDLEVFQHALTKWGHKESSFRCDQTTIVKSPEPRGKRELPVGPPEA